jgi:beta-galactosidase
MQNDHRRRWLRWPQGMDETRIGYGADYNPEQWSPDVWRQDVRLMREAGVNIVSLAIFSWARLQPTAQTWDFDWLDEVMDLLHENGIAVDLATATASPPPWLTTAHPEILPVDRNGHTVWPGARQHWRPTSAVFRQHALALVTAMADRYGSHPALAAWHVSNELGCHNAWDYSDDAVAAFRIWLADRYGDIETLNAAWGTSFWSQRYSDWREILVPRLAASHPNPTQQLDFRRFSSDALRDHLRAERDVLRQLTPDIPVTTNFMVMGQTQAMDYASWAGDVDFVANDHYVVPGPQALDELSFSANLTRNLGGGCPWFLMEHSPSAVNWQSVNVAKAPGAMLRDSLTHVAHGADAVCFFQWRQSASGAEKYHSAMVPHAGPDSEVFRSVVELGSVLRDLHEVAGSQVVTPHMAILFDWECWWTSELDSHPSSRVRYRQEALDWYSAALATGTRADIVPLSADLSRYDVVVAPILHVVDEELVRRLVDFVEGGGHLVATYFSGIVDRDDHVHLGGYPGLLRDLLGIRIEEFAPLLEHERVALDNGTSGTLWTDQIETTDPETHCVASYLDGPQSGRPAVTRRVHLRGSATYVSTRLGVEGIVPVLASVLRIAEVTSELPEALRDKVEMTVRANDDTVFTFLINRTNERLHLGAIASRGTRLAQTGDVSDTATLAPRGVMVLASTRGSASAENRAARGRGHPEQLAGAER